VVVCRLVSWWVRSAIPRLQAVDAALQLVGGYCCLYLTLQVGAIAAFITYLPSALELRISRTSQPPQHSGSFDHDIGDGDDYDIDCDDDHTEVLYCQCAFFYFEWGGRLDVRAELLGLFLFFVCTPKGSQPLFPWSGDARVMPGSKITSWLQKTRLLACHTTLERDLRKAKIPSEEPQQSSTQTKP